MATHMVIQAVMKYKGGHYMKTKKMIALAAVFAMLSAALPAGTPAANAQGTSLASSTVSGTQIEKIDVTIKIPKAGDKASIYASDWITGISDDIEAASIQWITEKEHYTHMPYSDTFEAGKTYTGVVYFSIYGYNISDKTNVTVNGKEAKYCPYESASAFMGFEFDFTVSEPVETVNISIDEPYTGKKADGEAITDNADIVPTVEMIQPDGTTTVAENAFTWYDGAEALVRGDKFSKGKTYTAEFRLVPKNGASINTDTKVFVNGIQAETIYIDGSGNGAYQVEFTSKEPEVIKKVELTLTEPKAGEKPDFKIKSSAPEGAVEIYKSDIDPETNITTKEENTFIWCEHIDGGAGYIVEADSVFEEGHTYTAELEMKAGNRFLINKDTKFYINGKEAKPSEYTDYSGTIYYSADFALERKYAVGDVNADGNIDIEDAVLVINHVNGAKALTDDETKRANVDGSKSVDIEDAVAIISHVNGVKALS